MTDEIKRRINNTGKDLKKYIRKENFSVISVDIAVVEIKFFRKKIKKTDVIIGIISLYQIDNLIRDKLSENSNKLY